MRRSPEIRAADRQTGMNGTVLVLKKSKAAQSRDIKHRSSVLLCLSKPTLRKPVVGWHHFTETICTIFSDKLVRIVLQPFQLAGCRGISWCNIHPSCICRYHSAWQWHQFVASTFKKKSKMTGFTGRKISLLFVQEWKNSEIGNRRFANFENNVYIDLIIYLCLFA